MKYIQCCAFEHKWSKGINVVVYSVAAILLSQQKQKKLQHKFPLNPKLPICSTPIQYKSIQKHLKFRDHFPPLHSQDLVIIPLLGLLEEPLSSLQAFFYLAVILAVLCSRLVVLNSWKIKRHRMESSLLTHPKVANGKWSALFIRQSFSGSEHTCFKTLLLANMYPPEVSLSKAVKPPMSRGNVISPRLFFSPWASVTPTFLWRGWIWFLVHPPLFFLTNLHWSIMKTTNKMTAWLLFGFMYKWFTTLALYLRINFDFTLKHDSSRAWSSASSKLICGPQPS